MPPYACCLSGKLAVVGCVVFQLLPFPLVADLNTLRPFQLKGSRKVSNALKHVRLVRQMQNFKRIKIFLNTHQVRGESQSTSFSMVNIHCFVILQIKGDLIQYYDAQL